MPVRKTQPQLASPPQLVSVNDGPALAQPRLPRTDTCRLPVGLLAPGAQDRRSPREAAPQKKGQQGAAESSLPSPKGTVHLGSSEREQETWHIINISCHGETWSPRNPTSAVYWLE